MNSAPVRILLFEDNPGDARLIKEYLQESSQSHFSISQTGELTLGLESLRRLLPDIILLDLGIPDSQGLETLLKVKSQAQIHQSSC